MFENEGTEIESTSDVENEPSSAAQPDAQSAATEAAAPVKEPPFHEHPRWIERQNELNNERQARAQLEQRVAEMQRQFEQSQKPRDTRPDFKELRANMAKRFEGIDPETQAYFAQLEEQALSAKEDMRQLREEQFVGRAVSKFDELTTKDKVPAEVASLYRAQLDTAYREGKIRNLGDLEKAYKSIHEPFNKMIEAREKAYLENYTKAKKADASKPAAQPKGRPASPSNAPQTFANDQQRKAAMVKDIVADLRASKDLG